MPPAVPRPAARDPQHIVMCYRRHILGCKRKWGTARGLLHYRDFITDYLRYKKELYRANAFARDSDCRV